MPHHPGLGRWVAPDPRSRNYPYRARVRRRSVLHSADAPITDQDGVGACVGFTVIDTLNTSKFAGSRRAPHGRRKYMEDQHGFDFYSLATRLDAWPEKWPPQDSGSSMLAGAKAMQRWGYIDSYEWAFTFTDFLAALERQPVMLGTLWTSGMDDPDSKGLVVPSGDLVGGHAYMAFGVNYVSERIKCRNHWTDQWGYDGDFFVTFADMEWLLAEQGEALVPAPRLAA